MSATTLPTPAMSTRPSLGRRLQAAFNKRALLWLAVGLFLFLYIPILILIIFSFNESDQIGVWTGFSLRWYGELIHDEAVLSALKLSLWVAIWSTIISTFLGTLTALALERHRFWGKITYDAILYLPIIIPDIVMALSTLLFFVVMGVALSRYTILIAHVAFNISFVAIVVRARLGTMMLLMATAMATARVVMMMKMAMGPYELYGATGAVGAL